MRWSMSARPATLSAPPTGLSLCQKRSVRSLPVLPAPAAQDVEAIWKFALTDEDTTKLNTFAKHVEQALGLSANGPRMTSGYCP